MNDWAQSSAGPSMNLSLVSVYSLLLGFFLIAGCAPQQTSRPVPPARRGEAIYHVVKPGENLFRIGKAYDISYEDLARANGIRDAAQIRVGQRILIPGANRKLPVGMITPSEPAMTEQSAPQPAETADDFILWPVQGTINSGFGPRGASLHDGIDIAAPEGTPIQAVERGEVIYSDQLRGYGNIVIIRHAGGLVSVYAHNQVNLVREGSMVERGDVIAKVGSTGRVTGPHLHFEIRKHNAAQDPVRYLPQLCCAPASDNVTPNG
jgi:murein DD-endopeptidase MepM/ murein hydrolase activator NlpD